MKSTRILLPSLIFGIAGGFALTGCIEQKQTAAAEPDMLQKDTTVYLQEGKETPSCKISISYAYLKPASEKDSISRLINEKIQEEAAREEENTDASISKSISEEVIKTLQQNTRY